MSIENQWLNVHDVADLLQIKEETVRRWIRRQELSVLELGGPKAGYRIRREDLDHFIWQRYRMRNQQESDRKYRLEFDKSAKRAQPSKPLRLGADQDHQPVAISAMHENDKAAPVAASDDDRYLSLLSRIPGITYIADLRGNNDSYPERHFAFISSDFERILALPASDLRANQELWWRRVHPDDVERVRAAYQQSFNSGMRLNIEYRILSAQGETCWVRDEAVVGDVDANNSPVWQGIILNITDRKQIEATLQSRTSQQAAIAELGDRALHAMDVDSLMEEAVNFVQRSLKVDYAKVLQLLPGGEALELKAGVGWKRGLVSRATVSAGAESQAGYTLLSNEPVIVTDLLVETRFNGPPLLHDHNVRSGISVIIAGTGKPWGVLGAHTTEPRIFTYDDVNFLQSVANILASAIQTARGSDHDGRWLSIRSVADTLRVKEETVRRWIRRGELPVIDLGSSRAGYRIHPADLEQFIQDRYVGNPDLAS